MKLEATCTETQWPGKKQWELCLMQDAQSKTGSSRHLQEWHIRKDVGRQANGQRRLSKCVKGLKMKINKECVRKCKWFIRSRQSLRARDSCRKSWKVPSWDLWRKIRAQWAINTDKQITVRNVKKFPNFVVLVNPEQSFPAREFPDESWICIFNCILLDKWMHTSFYSAEILLNSCMHIISGYESSFIIDLH